MQRRRLLFIASFALLALLVAALSQVAHYRAYRRLGDLEWAESASPQRLRETAEQALGFWFGDPHDAFVMLDQYGDASSIPYLETALEREPSNEDGIECTWSHAHAALDRLRRAAARAE